MDSSLNKQKIFEKVKNHLLKQNRKAEREKGKCRYKTATGLKCAIGCLISNEFYSSKFETWSISGIISSPNHVRSNALRKALKQSLELNEISTNDLKFLSKLQDIHDYEPIINWSFKLKNIAQEYALKYE